MKELGEGERRLWRVVFENWGKDVGETSTAYVATRGASLEDAQRMCGGASILEAQYLGDVAIEPDEKVPGAGKAPRAIGEKVPRPLGAGG